MGALIPWFVYAGIAGKVAPMALFAVRFGHVWGTLPWAAGDAAETVND